METYCTLKKYNEDIVTLNNNNDSNSNLHHLLSNSNEFNHYNLKASKGKSGPGISRPSPSSYCSNNMTVNRESVAVNTAQAEPGGTVTVTSTSMSTSASSKPFKPLNVNRLISNSNKWNGKEKVKLNRDVDVNDNDTIQSSSENTKTNQNGIISCKGEIKQMEVNSVVKSHKKIVEHFEPCSFVDAFFTYTCYFFLVVVGYINDLVRPRTTKEKHRAGYTQLYASFESFYTRHVYRRVRNGWNIPICSVPGKYVSLVHRITPDYGWTFGYTGKTIKCINMGSYNYLGFAENHGPCAEDSIRTISSLGVGTASSRKELGNCRYLKELEALVARFVGAEDALTCGMGFATNALNLPCILDSNCLVISDEKNHASIILGLRTSGATVRVFKHNNMKSLEKRLREGIVNGRPKTHLPWDKIFIVIEGVYSMEGSIVRLPEIVDLKRKYNAYIYLDEAHSIGAVGPRGRGVCDYWGVDPKEIDILMGTFTKSFGSAGGYIAGSREFIRMLKRKSHAHIYGTAMSAPVAEQIMSSMKIIMGEDGTNEGIRRIRQLARNSRYFRQKLKQLGFLVYGNDDSPVIPVILYMPSKIAYCVEEMIKRGVAIVGVGFPATPLVEGRIRFCMSASHTKEMLDYVLKEFAELGESICARTSSLPKYKGEILYEKI